MNQSMTSGIRESELIISGCHNLRDLGGLRSGDGRLVKRGLLFRAGVVTQIDQQSAAALRGLGIAAIYDLRANSERRNQDLDWLTQENIVHHSRDYENSEGTLRDLLATEKLNPAIARNIISTAYRVLPFEQAPAYRSIFQIILEGNIPLLFQCTAGKDRTGIIAGLILHVLGVPRPLIRGEYAQSQHSTTVLIEKMLGHPDHAGMRALPRECFLPLFDADPSYLDIAFEAIETRHGTIEAYLEFILGIKCEEVDALREFLLE